MLLEFGAAAGSGNHVPVPAHEGKGEKAHLPSSRPGLGEKLPLALHPMKEVSKQAVRPGRAGNWSLQSWIPLAV